VELTEPFKTEYLIPMREENIVDWQVLNPFPESGFHAAAEFNNQ
jgi:hypothetical protein